ncbi:hypothetical protein [Pararhizobium sp.]|uniref:hypothetical protein n=1 Tax=Pararhizobium sp. TaxID=1977563 RepID=UPI002727484B|nr:hypothetical protein [Pararhizobium sp.]MDO9415369.1 hypothetical protein [Pararhizobium sp.]
MADKLGLSAQLWFGGVLNGLIFGILPFAVLLLATLPLRKWSNRVAPGSYGKIVAFGCIGMFLGIFTGASKEPVVAAMLPASITLISGFTVYFFGKRESTDHPVETASLPATLCALVISSAFGAYYAANVRTVSLYSEQGSIADAERKKLEHSEIEVKLNKVQLCLTMFAGDEETKKSCRNLLAAK